MTFFWSTRDLHNTTISPNPQPGQTTLSEAIVNAIIRKIFGSSLKTKKNYLYVFTGVVIIYRYQGDCGIRVGGGKNFTAHSEAIIHAIIRKIFVFF